MSMKLEVFPLTPERWFDFERLFGSYGAYGGCWCMYWRITRSEMKRQHGEENRKAMKALVESNEPPGILGYAGGEPVAWCSVAPREQFGSLNRSPVLKRLDDTPVWSIVCFYIAKSHRNAGVMKQMIRGAIAHVRRMNGKVIEAYPTRPRGRTLSSVSSYMGLPSAFEEAGFVVMARPSEAKMIMRYTIEGTEDVHQTPR
jgi:GNAT superfamily N-acetyltransferase